MVADTVAALGWVAVAVALLIGVESPKAVCIAAAAEGSVLDATAVKPATKEALAVESGGGVQSELFNQTFCGVVECEVAVLQGCRGL